MTAVSRFKQSDQFGKQLSRWLWASSSVAILDWVILPSLMFDMMTQLVLLQQAIDFLEF